MLADLRDPQAILAHPGLRDLIDFTQPVALLLVAIVHFLTDAEDPAAIVATLRDALPDGSYLALSHATLDFHPPEVASQAVATYENATAPFVPRSRDQVKAFFDGFDLVEPGLVQCPAVAPGRQAAPPAGPGEDRHLCRSRPQGSRSAVTRPGVKLVRTCVWRDVAEVLVGCQNAAVRMIWH